MNKYLTKIKTYIASLKSNSAKIYGVKISSKEKISPFTFFNFPSVTDHPDSRNNFKAVRKFFLMFPDPSVRGAL